ncbi:MULTISPECIES: cold shock domain-containing protein [Streptomyces]|uniref:Major cold shock protein CspA n=1 Tax=Streptomyces noursei TaxID=1971 RepID=A0A059VPG2_STRNR|nr:cold shock domain-containing protein [Streptomyces noursei]AIA01254.1 major cold shock protein [Streptomyces noursei]GCB88871.1 major cold shock protein CspA [Streptomyces noursei]
MADRVSGVVRWYNQARGMGYIDGDDGRELRVDGRAIEDGTFVVEGLRVTYVPVEDENGWHAEHLNIVRHPPGAAERE